MEGKRETMILITLRGSILEKDWKEIPWCTFEEEEEEEEKSFGAKKPKLPGHLREIFFVLTTCATRRTGIFRFFRFLPVFFFLWKVHLNLQVHPVAIYFLLPRGINSLEQLESRKHLLSVNCDIDSS